MICTVIQNKTASGIEEIMAVSEMVEIRLDRCSLSDGEIEACFESDVPAVATCRVAEVMEKNPGMTEARAAAICEDLLCKAVRAGARYVDVEIEAPRYMSRKVRSCAMEYGTSFIKSYHDFGGTGTLEELKDHAMPSSHRKLAKTLSLSGDKLSSSLSGTPHAGERSLPSLLSG